MSERKQSIRAYMEARHAESWPILQSLRPEDLDRPVYGHGEEGWRIREVMVHLADAERGLLGQVKRLCAGEQTVPPDFDLERWNRRTVRKYADRPLEELLQQIEASFQEALAFLDSLPEEKLDLVGRHPSGQMLSTEDYLRRIVDHRLTHAQHIQQSLRGEAQEAG